jgi:hypothetical protein
VSAALIGSNFGRIGELLMTEIPAVVHNRLLVIDPGPFREVATEGGEVMFSRDGSFLPYLIEELVAHSALKIVTPKGGLLDRFAKHLPDDAQRYVEVVDWNRAASKTNALLAPLLHEFGVVEATPELIRTSGQDTPPAILVLFGDLLEFITGIEGKAEVSVNFERLKRVTHLARVLAKSSEARLVLARLEATWNMYATMSVPTIEALPKATPAYVEGFRRLLEDAEYAKLSKEAHNLGMAARSRRAVQLMRRCAVSVTSKSPFREIFNLGTTVITACSKTPLPDAETLAHVLQTSYLPPFFQMRDAYANAKNAWEAAKPAFIPPRLT